CRRSEGITHPNEKRIAIDSLVDGIAKDVEIRCVRIGTEVAGDNCEVFVYGRCGCNLGRGIVGPHGSEVWAEGEFVCAGCDKGHACQQDDDQTRYRNCDFLLHCGSLPGIGLCCFEAALKQLVSWGARSLPRLCANAAHTLRRNHHSRKKQCQTE